MFKVSDSKLNKLCQKIYYNCRIADCVELGYYVGSWENLRPKWNIQGPEKAKGLLNFRLIQ